MFPRPPLLINYAGSVSVVNDLKSNWPKVDSLKATLLFDYIWPNHVDTVSDNIFNRSGLFTVAGGFLVPGKSTGEALDPWASIHCAGVVSIFDVKTSPPTLYKISTDKSNFFFHEAQWWDIDGDGLEDILAARASKPVIGPSAGELVSNFISFSSCGEGLGPPYSHLHANSRNRCGTKTPGISRKMRRGRSTFF